MFFFAGECVTTFNAQKTCLKFIIYLRLDLDFLATFLTVFLGTDLQQESPWPQHSIKPSD